MHSLGLRVAWGCWVSVLGLGIVCTGRGVCGTVRGVGGWGVFYRERLQAVWAVLLSRFIRGASAAALQARQSTRFMNAEQPHVLC